MFAIADDVKFIVPPAVIAEMLEGFPALAWAEACLTSQTIKTLGFVQMSARKGWTELLVNNDRNEETTLPVHDIPDGSYKLDPLEADSKIMCLVDDGIYILGTPLSCLFTATAKKE